MKYFLFFAILLFLITLCWADESIIKHVPKDNSTAEFILIEKGDSFKKSRKLAKALDCYNQYLKIHPEDSKIYCKIGSVYFLLDEKAKEIDCLYKCIELKDSFAFEYFILAHEVINLKEEANYNKLSKTTEILNKGLAIGLKNLRDHIAFCYFLYSTQSCEFQTAIDAINKALEIYPDVVLFYALRGSAYTIRGQYEEAIQDINKAIDVSLDNESKNTDLNLYVGCKEEYLIPLREPLEGTSTYYNLGYSYFRLRKPYLATWAYLKGLSQKNNNVLFELASTLSLLLQRLQ
ncbi:tetratricopeptide repeat protein [Thermodesulfobacteriota bacterium]